MPETLTDGPILRPVSARSALLGLLIGAEVSVLSARELVAAGHLVGFSESAVRVALSRMVTSGDLVRTGDGRYQLSERLARRQDRQELAIHTPTTTWHGQWEMVVVTATGRSAADRAQLRTTLVELRLAEMREGVWLRPKNLAIKLPDDVARCCEHFTVAPRPDPRLLAARLWDLDVWAARARALLGAADTQDPVLRFTACATSARHLLEDPLLPAELLPAGWPGDELRRTHLEYKQWLIETRQALVMSP